MSSEKRKVRASEYENNPEAISSQNKVKQKFGNAKSEVEMSKQLCEPV